METDKESRESGTEFAEGGPVLEKPDTQGVQWDDPEAVEDAATGSPELDDGEDHPEDDDSKDDDPKDEEPEDEEPEDEEPPDLEHRILCPDGTCIGVIDLDGKCKECHEPVAEEDRSAYEAMLRAHGQAEAVEASHQARAETSHGGEQEEPEEGGGDNWWEEDEDKDEDVAADLEHRELCPDGTCVGIIGPDNTCKVCGKPRDWEEKEEEEKEEEEEDQGGERDDSDTPESPPQPSDPSNKID